MLYLDCAMPIAVYTIDFSSSLHTANAFSNTTLTGLELPFFYFDLF